MKILTILGLLQTALLLYLLGRLAGVEEVTTTSGTSGRNAVVGSDLSHTQSRSNARDIRFYANEDRLRQIIREELAEQLSGGVNPGNDVHARIAADSPLTAENQYQRELVSQQLDYYTSIGNISGLDMGRLQDEIAKLDPAGQREMLGKLTQALNSGNLDGHL